MFFLHEAVRSVGPPVHRPRIDTHNTDCVHTEAEEWRVSDLLFPVWMQPETNCPPRSKVSTRIVIFHITMVMYIHVYNTVSFSADTVINTTCKPIVESRPGQIKTYLNKNIWRTMPVFVHVLKLYILYTTSANRQLQFEIDSRPSRLQLANPSQITFENWWLVAAGYCIDEICYQQTNSRSNRTGKHGRSATDFQISKKQRELELPVRTYWGLSIGRSRNHAWICVCLYTWAASHSSEVKHCEDLLRPWTNKCWQWWIILLKAKPARRKETNLKTEGWFVKNGWQSREVHTVCELQHAKARAWSFKMGTLVRIDSARVRSGTGWNVV